VNRPLALAALLAASCALPCCDLPQQPLGGGDIARADVSAADGVDGAATEDVAGEPVPCSALGGTWQVSLCGSYAAPVQFVAGGCEALLFAQVIELDQGSARLDPPNRLTLVLPGGLIGALQCEAAMTPTSFTGTCANAVNRCNITGVRAY